MPRLMIAGLALVGLVACGRGKQQIAGDDTGGRNLERAPSASDGKLSERLVSFTTTTRTLGAGARIDATMAQAITSRSNKPGETVRTTVATDANDRNGRVVIPAGSAVELLITELEPAKNKSQADGKLTFQVTAATVRGQRYPMAAEVTSVPHTLKGRGRHGRGSGEGRRGNGDWSGRGPRDRRERNRCRRRRRGGSRGWHSGRDSDREPRRGGKRRSAGGHHAHGATHGLDEVRSRAIRGRSGGWLARGSPSAVAPPQGWTPLGATRALILMPPPQLSSRAQPRRSPPHHPFRLGDFMRPLTIAGILLIAFGAFVLLRGASFTSRRDVLKVGDVQVTADEQQSIPPWAGWLSIVAGGAMAVAGARRRA